jgi:hypothetical protein
MEQITQKSSTLHFKSTNAESSVAGHQASSLRLFTRQAAQPENNHE